MLFNALKEIIPTLQPADIEYKPFRPQPDSERTQASLLGQKTLGLKSSEANGIDISIKGHSKLGIDNALSVVHAITDFTGYVASTDGESISFFSGFNDLAAIDKPEFIKRVRLDTTPVRGVR